MTHLRGHIKLLRVLLRPGLPRIGRWKAWLLRKLPILWVGTIWGVLGLRHLIT